MRLVYPPEGHRTFESSTFLLGAVLPGSGLKSNQQDIPVSSHGFFAHPLVLQPGVNEIELVSQNGAGESASLTRTIVRETAPELTPLENALETITSFAFPTENLAVYPGETLQLYCPAPSGVAVTCIIPGLIETPIALTEATTRMDNREGVFAQLHQTKTPWPAHPVHTAVVRIPRETSPNPHFTIRYTLHEAGQTTDIAAQGTLTILSTEKSRYVQVTCPDACVRTDPQGGARLTPLLPNTVLPVGGFYGEQVQLRYAMDQSAWIDRELVSLIETPPFPERLPIHLIQTVSQDHDFEIVIPLQRPVPMAIFPYPDHILLQFYGVISRCDFIHYQPGVFQHGLRHITWQQVSDTVVSIRVELDSALHGVLYHFDEIAQALRFSIRTYQSLLQQEMLTIVLDPGHGGAETGATAPDGTPEKDLNLAIALRLKQCLDKVPHINVVLTRQTDTLMGLDERVAVALQHQAHLLLSLHHNALPDGRDPWAHQGVSTYYYMPFALPWARQFQNGLVRQTTFADYGLLYDSLHMCRVMAMPALLLELGFLTHPKDAERCLDPHHQGQVAEAIANTVLSVFRHWEGAPRATV